MSQATRSLAIHYDPQTKIVTLHLIGELTHESYQTLTPEIDRIVDQHGTVRMLVLLTDFTGWTPRAAWDDLKFGFKNARNVSRLAIAGDRKWEAGMATVIKPFTSAEVRFFPIENAAAAEQWLREGRLPGDSS